MTSRRYRTKLGLFSFFSTRSILKITHGVHQKINRLMALVNRNFKWISHFLFENMREKPLSCMCSGAENSHFRIAMCNLHFRAIFKGISSEVQCKFRDLSKQRCHEDNYDCVLQHEFGVHMDQDFSTTCIYMAILRSCAKEP